MTNSGDVYFTALTHTHAMSPCCTPPASAHDGKTKKADTETERYTEFKEMHVLKHRDRMRGGEEDRNTKKCILTERLKKLKLGTHGGTIPCAVKGAYIPLKWKEIALEVSI